MLDNSNNNVNQVHLSVLSETQITAIHEASLKVLEETGVDIFDTETISILKEAGCKVSDGNRVKIPRELVQKALAGAPKEFQIYNRKGEPAMSLGGYNSYFGTGSDCPNTIDLETGVRRLGRLDDVVRAASLCDYLPNIDFVMSFAIPADVQVNVSYLRQFATIVTNTTKPTIYVCDGRDIAGIVAVAEAVAGGEEALRERPFLILYNEPNTPLRHSESAMVKLKYLARKGLPMIYAPGIGAGGTTPITAAGSITVGNAEILSGLVIHQLINPGAPFIYGGGFSVLDMESMVVSYSAPEFVIRNAAITDIARYYGLPTFSFAGSTDSKLLDIQAGAETGIFSLVSALSGANLLHDVGYLESGLTGALEMIAIGNEIAGMVRKIKAGISVTPDELAVEAINDIGPGGNFIAHEHTYEHFRTSLWFPKLFKRHNYDGWSKAGKPTALELANVWVKEILESHRPEKVSDDILAEIDEIIDRAGRVK